MPWSLEESKLHLLDALHSASWHSRDRIQPVHPIFQNLILSATTWFLIVHSDPFPPPQIKPVFPLPAKSVVGDGKMVGDKAFDPFGLATSMAKLNNYREAELKHCRLAMLAALGWPVAELLQGPISRALGLPDLLQPGETCATAADCIETLSRAPSVLNGGLDQISPIYWISVIALSAGIEAYGLKVQKKANYLPGDLGFDPLGLYQKLDPKGKQDMQMKEVRLVPPFLSSYACVCVFIVHGTAVQAHSIFTSPFTSA